MTDRLKPDEFHTATISVHEYGAGATFHCSASEGADCRMGCPVGCESWPCEHDLEDAGRCLLVEWLGAEAFEDSIDGEHVLYDGPISTEWSGDGYLWSPATPEETR